MSDVIFKTSGSTGVAKQIVRSEASLQADAVALVKAFPEVWRGAPLVVASVPADHMYGALWRVRAPAAAGCVVSEATVLSEEELAAACLRAGRIVFITTPSFLEKVLHHPDFALLKGHFAAVVTAGSELRKETSLAIWKTLGICPLEIFGSTETGTVAWRKRMNGDEWTLVEGVSARQAEGGMLEVDSPFAMSRPCLMSDGVAFTASNRFRLLGRLDRRVKILEEFVSLPEVESELEKHPYVARACVETNGMGGVPRLGAVVVLSDRGVEALARTAYAEVCAQLRRDLYRKIPGIAFPRKFRFVRELPVNARGKTSVVDIRSILAANWQEPVVRHWQVDEGELSAQLIFPPDSTCFHGHFPNFPILPGVAQLFYLRHFARQAFCDFPETQTFRRLKFQKVIFPQDVVTLTVTRRDDRSFAFSLVGANGPCASGIVEESAE